LYGNIELVKRLVLVGVVLTALLAAAAAPAAPLPTISRYVSNADPARWFDLGCALGNAVASGTRPKDSGVVLDFGDPAYVNGVYGARLFDGSFRSTTAVRHVAEQYGLGYYYCSPFDSSLRIALGTTNHGYHVSYAHGAAWANMVDATNHTFADGCCAASQVAAIGGIDSELDWNSFKITKHGWTGTTSRTRGCT
jgi:hypothetical protein